MPRRLRIEYAGADRRVMERANARSKIVRDDADRRRLSESLEGTVVRRDWELLCYAVMGIHIRLKMRNSWLPEPMQPGKMKGVMNPGGQVDVKNHRNR